VPTTGDKVIAFVPPAKAGTGMDSLFVILSSSYFQSSGLFARQQTLPGNLHDFVSF